MDSYFDADSLLGEAIGDWRLEALLGEGGMSFIFRGVHVSSGLKGAVKLLRPEFCLNQQTLLRFEQEARLAGQLQHENIVRVLDFGRDETRNWYFMVLELLDGLDLGSMMSQAPFPKRWIAALIQQICSALESAHSEGIIHRDLKPSNIFLLPRKPFPLVKLLDFGVAKLIYQQTELQITQAGEIIGTPAYVAPEQFSPKEPLTHRADIYALGVLLFQLFTGKLPIDGGSAIAHAVMVLQQEAPLLREHRSEFAETQLESLVQRLLSKQASLRPASMRETWELFCEVVQVLSDPLDTAANVPDLDALLAARPAPLVAEESAQPKASDVAQSHSEPDDVGEATFVMPEGAADSLGSGDPLEDGETTFVVTSPLGDGNQSAAVGAVSHEERERLRRELEGVDIADTAVDRRDPRKPASVGGVAVANARTELELSPLRIDIKTTKEPPQATEVELEAADPGEMTMMDEPLPVVVGVSAESASSDEPPRGREKEDVATLLEGVLGNETTRDSSDLVEQVRAYAGSMPLSPEQEAPWAHRDPKPNGTTDASQPIALTPQPTATPAETLLDGVAGTPPNPPKRAIVPPVVWGFLVVLLLAGVVLGAAWLIAKYLI